MKHRFASLAVVVVVALGLGLLFATRSAHAVPPVTWQPEPFDIALPPGEKLSTPLTVTASRDIPASRVEVSPSLAPYVASIEPATLPALPKGSRANIILIFQVSTGTPQGTINGSITLRDDNSYQNVTQMPALPISLKVGDLLYPPDPGEAGKETLEGIDADGDGLRDDVQRYIEITYPDQPDVRAGLRQSATPLLHGILDANNKQASISHAMEETRAENCLAFLLGIEGGYQAGTLLLAQALNTDERSIAYMKYDQQLGGHVFPGTPSEDWHLQCDHVGGVQ